MHRPAHDPLNAHSDSFHKKLFTQKAILAVCLTGVLGFLMHPFSFFGYRLPDMGPVAWLYLIPLVLGTHRHNLKHKLILAFFSALIFNFGTFYWLIIAMMKYGGLNFFTSFALLTLCVVILSAFFAFFFGFACWINHVIKLPLCILLPLFLITKDFILSVFPFGGFPWGIPAYSQGLWIQFFQWVDYTGVLGLDLLVYLINGLIADGLILWSYRKHVDKLVARLLVVFVISLVSVYVSFLSAQQFEKSKKAKGNLNVALIQGNISQDVKWDPYQAQDNLGSYLRLTRLAAKDRVDLAIWPESAYPYSIDEESLHTDKFLDREKLPVPIFFGTIVRKKTENKKIAYNATVYADADAAFRSAYYKMHLVPFGEYIPFPKIFGRFPKLVEQVGYFTPGTEDTIFELNGIRFGSLICFEDVFSENARQMALNDADVLINYTNDAWYEDSSAQYQHLVFSQFRALETRRYLLRATNTGVTAVINPRGQVVDFLDPFKKAYLLHNFKVETASSYFTQHGSRWAFVLALLCGLTFFYAVIKCRLGPVRIEF